MQSLVFGRNTGVLSARPQGLTCPVVGLVARVSDLGPQLEVVSRLVARGTVRAQGEHAAGETRQVAHLPLQVPVLPLADERQTAVGFADQVALDSLGGGHRFLGSALLKA